MPSMPTASRTRSGRDAGGQLLLGGELRVRGRRRVDDQRAHVADVGDVAVQLSASTNALPASTPPSSSNASDRAGALGRVLLAALVPRRAEAARRS